MPAFALVYGTAGLFGQFRALLAFHLRFGKHALMLGQLLVQRFKTGLELLAVRLQLFALYRQLFQLFVDAATTLLRLLRLLCQLGVLQLHIVHTGCQLADTGSGRNQTVTHLLQGHFGLGAGMTQLVHNQLGATQLSLDRAVAAAGYRLGDDVMIALDCAASELYKGKDYDFKKSKQGSKSAEAVGESPSHRPTT